jgi:hypothetical protein
MMARAAAVVRRVPPAVAVLLAAGLLLVPGLGRFGLWEPWETELAGRGPAAAQTDRIAAALTALGLRLGGGEGGLRAGLVILALAAVLAVFWAGAGMHGRRPALLAVAVLLSLPLFSLQARQLTSEMPLCLALALAIGGLGRLAWPLRAGPSRDGVAAAVVAAGVAVAGLTLGLLCGGALVGVLGPCAAFAAAALVEPPVALGRTTRSVLVASSLAAVALVAGLAVAQRHTAGLHSAVLGGAPSPGPSGQTFASLARQAGFGLFPWSALAFFALSRGLTGEEGADPASRSRAGAALFLLLATTFVLVLSTVRAHFVGQVRFVALAPVALALGAFLDDVTGERRAGPSPERLLGVLAALGTVVVARDLYLAPEELAWVHTLASVTWPIEVRAGGLLLGIGVAFAVTVAVALGLDLRAGGRRRAAIAAALGVALAFAVLLDHWLVPALSRHLSRRALVDVYRRAATAGQPLARYRARGEGAGTWHVAPGPELPTRDALVQYLRGAERRFALVSTAELASLDEGIKLGGGSYAVLDASSRLLLVASRLAPGEEDRNPLLRNVWTSPDPAGPARPPWPEPRVTTSAVFAGAVELVGADFPLTVRRPGSLHLALVFRVLRRPPAGYGIFVHLEQPGALLHGDHQPVGGVFPTARWLPGEHVRDEHVIELPLEVTTSPTYRLLVGFWPGSNRPRLPITAGASDGADRCPLGTVTVR